MALRLGGAKLCIPAAATNHIYCYALPSLWALLTVFLATMAETWLQQVFTPQSSPEQTRQVQCGKDLPSCSFTGPWLAFAACAGSTILTRAARPGHPLRHRRAIGFRSLTSCTELAVT